MRKSAGFTLIELLIAVSLSALVLVGVATLFTSMTKNQIEGIRAGTDTGWALVSYKSMIKEIADANVLAYPAYNGPQTSDSIVVCHNWSRILAGRIDTTLPTKVVGYCLDTTTPSNYLIRRLELSVNCPDPGAAILNCSQTPAAPWMSAINQVVGYRVQKTLPLAPTLFTRDSIGGMRVQYSIGTQVATTLQPVPSFISFDVDVPLQKQYNNTFD
ncbi:MAG: prepilin-type N-terminal cleavage/methylation domain-containing protein [Elusimicrobiota bacterium]